MFLVQVTKLIMNC